MVSKVKLPSHLSILAPRPSGTLSRNRQNPKGPDPQRTFRCPDDKFDAIIEASSILGMTNPEFVRWVSYMAANEVLRLAREQQVPVTPVKIEVINPKPQVTVDIPTRTIYNPYTKK